MPRDFKFDYALENSSTQLYFSKKKNQSGILLSFEKFYIFLLQFYEVAALFVDLSMINFGP